MIDLKKLWHMSVLAREGQFFRAAAKLHLTQSALTRSIQALEAELDVRIFDRSRTGVTLTPMGKLLMEKSESLLREANSIQKEIALVKEHKMGAIRFGMGPLPARVLLANILTACARDHPALQIGIEMNDAAVLTRSLLDEDIEFFVSSLPQIPNADQFRTTPLGSLDTSFFVRPGHPLARKKKVSYEDMLQYPIASGTPTPAGSAALDRLIKRGRHDRPLVTLNCEDFYALEFTVLSSDIIFLTARAGLGGEFISGKLVELKAPLPRLSAANLVIASLAGRTLSPAANLLTGLIAKEMKEINASGK